MEKDIKYKFKVGDYVCYNNIIYSLVKQYGIITGMWYYMKDEKISVSCYNVKLDNGCTITAHENYLSLTFTEGCLVKHKVTGDTSTITWIEEDYFVLRSDKDGSYLSDYSHPMDELKDYVLYNLPCMFKEQEDKHNKAKDEAMNKVSNKQTKYTYTTVGRGVGYALNGPMLSSTYFSKDNNKIDLNPPEAKIKNESEKIKLDLMKLSLMYTQQNMFVKAKQCIDCIEHLSK